MQNLGFTKDNLFGSDQSKPGSFLDLALQTAFPAFGLMRNLKAMEDDKYAPGTFVGLGQDIKQGGQGLLNNWFGDSSDPVGLMGQSPWDTGSYVDMGGWGYGTIDGVGVEDGNYGSNSSAQSDYTNVSWDNMTEDEASSWDSF